MPQFVAPGVYIVERDFSDYVASLQQTSLGMVGTAKRGPLDEPTLCTTPEEFIAKFGEPSANMYGPFAALNYLRRGNQLYYCRVAKQYNTGVATIVSLGTPDGDDKITQFTVTGGHGITAPSGDTTTSWIRIRQSGNRTSANLAVTAVSSNTITVATPLLSNDYDTAAVVDLSTSVDAANAAEVAASNRAAATVTPVVRFTAVNEGAWANFGSKSGIEIIVEDSGQFQNIDPITGDTLESTTNVPLTGVVTTAPSVDTKIDLLSLTSTQVKNGELRGVNQDSVVKKVTNVSLSSNVATLTLDSVAGLSVSDEVTIANISNNSGAFNGVRAITSMGGSTISFALTHADVSSAAATPSTSGVICSAQLVGSETFGTVFKATVSSGTVTWAAAGLLTKRVKVYFAGRQVEVFDNLVGLDSTSTNYWDTVIGTPDSPVSSYIYAEYLGSVGEQPMNTYHKVKYPNNPRLLMGLSTSVKTANTSSSASVSFGNAAGANGDNPGSAELIGTIDESGDHTGLQNFRRTNDFDVNMICVPASTDPDVLNEIIDVCEDRADCLGILDTPLGFTVQEAVDWHNGTGVFSGDHAAFVTNKCAMYYPWVKVFDPYTQRDIWLPPSAMIPGVIAYNDENADIWFAPAGVNRGRIFNARQVEHNCSQGDMEVMYGPGNGNALNPIVSFKREGICVYGQRTLQRVPTALDRINVRRLLFYVEKAIATSCRRLVFEQDDPILWAQLTALITPFLTNLKGRRALEDFRVVCDASTNPPIRRNNNEVGARILLIPVKSAEKIVLEFTLLPSGADFNEFIAATN
jgi:phage tail sheath protein FI